MPFPFFFFSCSFCFFLLLLFLRRLFLRAFQPQRLQRGARIRLPVQVQFAGGRFGGGAGVTGRVADHGLAHGIGLVARFALLRLARPGDIRIGVVVQVVVVDQRTELAPRRGFPIDRGATGRRRGGEALGVDPVRRENRQHASERADADVLGQGAREVAERQRQVVTRHLLGREPRHERVAERRRLRQVFQTERDDGVLRERLERLRGIGQLRVQRRRRAEVDGAFGERVGKRLGDRAQPAGGRAQQAHEFGAFFHEGRLVGERVGGLLQRRRATFDRLFQRGSHACPCLEERVEVAPEARVLLGNRGGLRGGPVERVEQLAEARLRRGEVVQRRGRADHQRAQRRDRFVQPQAARGEAVAEVDRIFLNRGSRLLVEHVEELVEVDRFTRLADRDRRALLERLLRCAPFQFQVLRPDRRR